MKNRQTINIRAMVRRRTEIVGPMRLEASVLADGRVVGTVDCQPHLEHPLGHPVPRRFVVLRNDEPKFYMVLPDGRTVEFHIGSTFGVLLNARCIYASAHHGVTTQEPATGPARVDARGTSPQYGETAPNDGTNRTPFLTGGNS